MRRCMHPLFSGGFARRHGRVGYVCRERRIDGVGGGASRRRLRRFGGNGFARCMGQRPRSAIGFFLQRSIRSRASRVAVCGLGSGGRCRSMGAWDCGFRLPSVWGYPHGACRGGRDGDDCLGRACVAHVSRALWSPLQCRAVARPRDKRRNRRGCRNAGLRCVCAWGLVFHAWRPT